MNPKKKKQSNKKVLKSDYKEVEVKQKSDEKKKGYESNVKSCANKQKTCANKKKKLPLVSPQNQNDTGCLFVYKKKNLSEVNYFLLKNKKEHQEQKSKEEFSTELCQNAAPPKSFWNRSTDDLENGLKQIIIHEKKDQKQGRGFLLGKNCNRDQKPKKETSWSSSFNSYKTFSLEEKSTYQGSTAGDESNLTKDKNKDVSNKLDNNLLPQMKPERKYYLDDFLLKKTKTKGTKTPAVNKNAWQTNNSDQKNPNLLTPVTAWLQANEICLDQIMMKEKINNKIKLEPTRGNMNQKAFQESDKTIRTNYLPQEEPGRRYDQFKQHSKYYDNIYVSQNDTKMPDKTYSLEYQLQSDSASNLSEEWLWDNQICLDQIIIEEKIKRKLKFKHYSETSSEETCPNITPKVSAKKITTMPIFLNTLIKGFKLYNTYSSKKPYILTQLDTSSPEYNKVKDMFFKSVHTYKIDSIKKVINPYLLLHYSLRKATSSWGEEKLLFHGTKIENFDSICTENFDWRLVERHLYGWGVSFSNSAYYASHYSDKSAQIKVMFVVKVFVGLEWFGDCITEVPPEPFDTTTNLDGRVYVKFDDCSFYPAYVIFYKDDVIGKRRK